MNSLLNAIKKDDNYKLTENGGIALKSSLNAVLDLFAFGGAYRSRSDEDCILLFKNAFEENAELAMKCLFYLRDTRGGQGERRFFRVVFRWLVFQYPKVALPNLRLISEYGRYDDLLYICEDTPLWDDAMQIIRKQLFLDEMQPSVSLLGKWLPSENASSEKTKQLASKVRKSLNLSSKNYRKMLSVLREKIRVVEKLMSSNRWDDIQFDKLPSKAGLNYRKAFSTREETKERYAEFASNKYAKVNADILYPCEVVQKARFCKGDYDNPERLMINKYWDNLKDYFNGASFNGVAVVDTSGSMLGTTHSKGADPIDVAIALGMYCAEKCNKNSPWYGNYISFSRKARLVPIKGIDFVDKVTRIYKTNLCENTNIENVFDFILRTAVNYHVPQSDMPENVIIISDMEFDPVDYSGYQPIETVMETCGYKYQELGYEIPHLIFWNVDARQDTIPMLGNNISFISGYNPVMLEQILANKSGMELMLDKLNSERYALIHAYYQKEVKKWY